LQFGNKQIIRSNAYVDVGSGGDSAPKLYIVPIPKNTSMKVGEVKTFDIMMKINSSRVTHIKNFTVETPGRHLQYIVNRNEEELKIFDPFLIKSFEYWDTSDVPSTLIQADIETKNGLVFSKNTVRVARLKLKAKRSTKGEAIYASGTPGFYNPSKKKVEYYQNIHTEIDIKIPPPPQYSYEKSGNSPLEWACSFSDKRPIYFFVHTKNKYSDIKYQPEADACRGKKVESVYAVLNTSTNKILTINEVENGQIVNKHRVTKEVK